MQEWAWPLTYLIAASFMAAPAGLLFAKILFPQTEQFNDKQPETDDSEKPTNVLEAWQVVRVQVCN